MIRTKEILIVQIKVAHQPFIYTVETDITFDSLYINEHRDLVGKIEVKIVGIIYSGS